MCRLIQAVNETVSPSGALRGQSVGNRAHVFGFCFGCSSTNPRDKFTAVINLKKAYIWLEESQELAHVSHDVI